MIIDSVFHLPDCLTSQPNQIELCTPPSKIVSFFVSCKIPVLFKSHFLQDLKTPIFTQVE